MLRQSRCRGIFVSENGKNRIHKITIGIKILQNSTNRALSIARGRFFAFLRDIPKISKIHKND